MEFTIGQEVDSTDGVRIRITAVAENGDPLSAEILATTPHWARQGLTQGKTVEFDPPFRPWTITIKGNVWFTLAQDRLSGKWDFIHYR